MFSRERIGDEEHTKVHRPWRGHIITITKSTAALVPTVGLHLQVAALELLLKTKSSKRGQSVREVDDEVAASVGKGAPVHCRMLGRC